MSIWSEVDALFGSGDLEVHVAEMILIAEDVGQDRGKDPSSLEHEAHSGHTGTGAFSGTPASIIDSDPPQTDAIEDDPFDSVISETIRTV